MKSYIIENINATRDTMGLLLEDEELINVVERIAKVIIEALQNGKKVMFAGNGGSAADSQHLAAELVSRLNYDRPGLAAVALTTDTSALTAIGNDYGYDRVFARQIEAIGVEGDVFVGISTSGNSQNILSAFDSAKKKKISMVGFTGKSGGQMNELCDYIMKIPSECTPNIQECHIMLGHIICALVEDVIFGDEYKLKQ